MMCLLCIELFVLYSARIVFKQSMDPLLALFGSTFLLFFVHFVIHFVALNVVPTPFGTWNGAPADGECAFCLNARFVVRLFYDLRALFLENCFV